MLAFSVVLGNKCFGRKGRGSVHKWAGERVTGCANDGYWRVKRIAYLRSVVLSTEWSLTLLLLLALLVVMRAREMCYSNDLPVD